MKTKIGKILVVIVVIYTVIGIGIMIIPGIVDSIIHRDMYDNSPIYQRGTKWESKDSIVELNHFSDGYVLGTLETESESIDVQFFIYKYDIYVLSIEEGLNNYLLPPESGEYLEKWKCDYLSKDEFVAVVEETTYFEVGKKITFHRTSRNIGDREEFLSENESAE